VVERYDLVNEAFVDEEPSMTMSEVEDGEYVKHADYERDVAALRRERDEWSALALKKPDGHARLTLAAAALTGWLAGRQHEAADWDRSATGRICADFADATLAALSEDADDDAWAADAVRRSNALGGDAKPLDVYMRERREARDIGDPAPTIPPTTVEGRIWDEGYAVGWKHARARALGL
jgi:hypothetical protein